MPAVIPAELWQESGRWEKYGKALLRLKDRYDRDFCFGPTHEEVVTDLVRREVRSYRDLPKTLYQIQVKFRDEVRPRFGLMRGREFIMKDAYSFHADVEDARREYQVMYDAYTRIFERCGLTFRAVEADTGDIGGDLSHEFQVLADSGEDAIVSCARCGYAANVEKAEVRPLPPPAASGGALERVATPGKRTVEEVGAFLGAAAGAVREDARLPDGRRRRRRRAGARRSRGVGDEAPGGARRRDRSPWRTSATVDARHAARRSASPGRSGSACACSPTPRCAERAAWRPAPTAATSTWSASTRSATSPTSPFADLRQARCRRRLPALRRRRVRASIAASRSARSSTSARSTRAPMGATFLGADGQERPIEMGCYGIGITRTVAAAIEQHHDDDGIVWPAPLAPFGAHVVPVNVGDATLRETAERIAARARGRGRRRAARRPRRAPGREVQGRRPDRPARARHGRAARAGAGLRRGEGARERARSTEVPVGEVAGRVARLVGLAGRSRVIRRAHRHPAPPPHLRARRRSPRGGRAAGPRCSAPRSAPSRSASSSSSRRGPRWSGWCTGTARDVFLDLKFHDIPTTVAKAGVEAARLGVRFFDLHASGSLAMMTRTREDVARVCRREGLRRPRILAVTVLTSLARRDLRLVGVDDDVEDQVVRLARLATTGRDGRRGGLTAGDRPHPPPGGTGVPHRDAGYPAAHGSHRRSEARALAGRGDAGRCRLPGRRAVRSATRPTPSRCRARCWRTWRAACSRRGTRPGHPLESMPIEAGSL